MRSDQIRYFLEVAKYGSMLKVAEKNFITQPAVSTAISKLEKELGVTLIQRSNQGAILTKAGLEAQATFSQIQQLVQQLDKNLSLHRNTSTDHQEGKINFCITGELGVSLLKMVNNQFYTDYPHCLLMVKECDFIDMITMVGGGFYEFGLYCIIDDMLEDPTINQMLDDYHVSTRRLGSDRLAIGVSKQSPLAKKSVIPLKTALQNPLIIYHSSIENCWYELFLQRYGVSSQLIKTNSLAYLQDLVQKRRCIDFLLNGKMFANAGMTHSPFAVVPIKEHIKVSIGILRPKNQKVSDLSLLFLKEVKKTLDTLS